MQVREANENDVNRIAELFGQLGYATGPALTDAKLRHLRATGNGEAFVAQQGDQVVGIAIIHLLAPLHVAASWALLSALVVDEKHRSSGVGKQLLRRVEGFAHDHGCAQLELSSSAARVEAHAFYERNGYREKRLRFVKALG